MKIEIAPRITADPNVSFGKPVIAGTRVPVEIVVDKLGGGMTIDEVMDDYVLTRDDALAAVAYAQHRPENRRLWRRLPQDPEGNDSLLLLLEPRLRRKPQIPHEERG